MKRRGKQGGRVHPGRREGNAEAQGSYGWFRSWVLGRDPEATGSGGEAAPEIDSVPPDKRAVWFRRMWEEGGRAEREISLRVFAVLQPGDAGSLFREIVASEQIPLWDKKLARDLLRAGQPQADTGEDEARLDAAWQCVEALVQDSVDADGQVWTREVRASFSALPAAWQGAVAAEVFEQAPDRAVAFLGCVLPERKALWEVVLGSLAHSPHPGVAELIRDGYRRTEDRSLRKRMKRTNHQRRARGLPALPLEEEEDRRAVWAPPVAARPTGLFAVGDTPEGRLVWIVRRNVSAGMLVFTGWVHARLGLAKFLVMELSKADARSYVEAILKNPEIKAGEADPGYCAFLLEESYKRGAPADEEEAEAYRRVRMRIQELLPAGAAPPPHPVQAVPALEEAEGVGGEGPLSAQDVSSILDHPLLQDWPVEEPLWKAHQGKLEEILNSRIIVHPLQRRERVEAFYRQVAVEVLGDMEERRRWKTRVEDAAWAVCHGGDRDKARRLARAGLALGSLEEDPWRDRFFLEVVRRTLESGLRQRRTEKEETPSLIVRPS